MGNLPMTTLHKISFSSPEELENLLNKNFAIIQNSPLFKGIPGLSGDPGEQGIRGIRGSIFIFVDAQRFIAQYPDEIRTGSDISLEFINTKLSQFDTKIVLLKTLGVTELVDHDILVLTNTVMVTYSLPFNYFVDSGIAFNTETNIASSIEKKIEIYVKEYVDNHPAITSIKNIFDVYETYGKVFSDNNNTFITRERTDSSVYMPYMPGYSNNTGIQIADHRYFGYTDKEFPKDNRGTFVIGSMKRYIDLMNGTIDPTQTETFNSQYSPGENNIPTIVMLQDTTNNGLFFGLKSKKSFQTFGRLYKDEDDNVVISSNMSPAETETSTLLINRLRMSYNKLVTFMDDLHVAKDFQLMGNIKNPFLRTNEFTSNKQLHKIEVGSTNKDSEIELVSDTVKYRQYFSNVLVTDDKGIVLKSYAIETIIQNPEELDAESLVGIYPSNKNNIITSDYVKFLTDKINNLITHRNETYWRKTDFPKYVIPTLNLKNDLNVYENVTFGKSEKYFSGNVASKNVELGFQDGIIKLNSKTIRSPQYKNNVLITNNDGTVSHDYSLETTVVNSIADIQKLMTVPNANKHVVTTNYLQWAIKYTNNLEENVKDNYWNKNDFETGIIPNLKVSDDLSFGKKLYSPDFHFAEKDSWINSNISFLKPVTISSQVKFPNIISGTVFVVSDLDGMITNKYSLEQASVPDMIQSIAGDSNVIPADSRDKILTSYYFYWLYHRIKETQETQEDDYWTKTDFNSWKIPNIYLTGNVFAKGDAIFGDQQNPFIKTYTTGKYLEIGTKTVSTRITSSDLRLPEFILTDADTGANKPGKREDAVVVVGKDTTVKKGFGLVKDSYLPVDVPTATTSPSVSINETAYSDSYQSILTGQFQNWVIKILNKVFARFKNTYNKTEVDDLLYKHFPVGFIAFINGATTPIPDGWAICDGRPLPGTTYNTPNMVDRFIKCMSKPEDCGPGGSNLITLSINHMPKHAHGVSMAPAGRHKHPGGTIGDHTHRAPSGSVYYVTMKGPDWSRAGGKGTSKRYTLHEEAGPAIRDRTGGVASGNTGITIPEDGEHSHPIKENPMGGGQPITINPQHYSLIAIQRYRK